MPDRNARLLQFAANMERRRRAVASSSEAQATTSLRTDLEKLKDEDVDSYLAEKLAWVPSEDYVANAETLRVAEDAAALCRSFAPADLIAALHIEGVDARNLMLNRLAAVCSVEVENDRTVWLLRGDRRSNALQRLVSEGRLPQALAQPLPPTDPPGNMLRRVLRGDPVVIEILDRQSLLDLAWALEVLTAIDLPKPNLAKVRRQLSSDNFLNDYDILLAKGFFGREPELAKLNAFLRSPGGGRRLLTLSGLGGSGKSTLLAKFARDVLSARSATVVLLDFDRPGLDAQDTVSLAMEITRQVGVQFPQGDQSLREARERVRRMAATQFEHRREKSSASDSEEDRGSFFELLNPVANTIEGGTNLPLLLILDTFEEVTQRDLTGRIMEWLSNVESILRGIPLRVIISGRMFERTGGTFKGYGVTEISIGEFSPQIAAAYLEAMGVPSSNAVRLANSDVLPRRPLELSLLARLTAASPALSIDDLEAELRGGGNAAKTLYAGLVYRRVLQRISVIEDGQENFGLTDDVLRLIAYPGLILRYVNAQLIQQILVPALDLPPFTEQKATRALELLTRHEWLSLLQDGNVWHRRDLRRSVLKPMIAEDPARATRIHKQAIAHLLSGPTESDRAEAVYHALMLVGPQSNPAQLELDIIRKAAQYFEADRVDLPQGGAALLTLAQTGDVAIDSIPLLPESFRPALYQSKGQSLIGVREFGTALSLYTPSTAPLAPWEQTLLCATAEWDKLRARALPAGKSWKEMGPLIFAASLVQSKTLAETETEFRQWGMGDAPAPSGASAELESLCVGLLMIAGGTPLPEYIRRSVEILHRRYTTFAEAELTLAKRFLLLWLASQSLGQDPLPIGPSTICLDPQWLAEAPANFAKLTLDPVDTSLFSTIGDSISGPAAPSRTSKWLLNYVQHLKPSSLIRIDKPNPDRDVLWWFLQNPNPEFRDPARFAVLDAFPDVASYPELAAIFEEVIPFALTDVNADSFTVIVSADPEHALESWIELADRTGTLEALLAKAAVLRPQSKKVSDVLAALQRWHAAVHNTISNFLNPQPRSSNES